VNPSELAFFILLTVLLVGLAGYFAWKQVQTLRALRTQPQPSAEDRGYLRRQAVRRLVCCALMLVLAGLLVGYLMIDPHYRAMIRDLEANPPADGGVPPGDRDFARFFAAYWVAFLFVLFVLIALAMVDFWAIARFGMRHRRQLQADHRALLHEEIARLRRRHNGESFRPDEPSL
jgi:hypothetical protein